MDDSKLIELVLMPIFEPSLLASSPTPMILSSGPLQPLTECNLTN